MPVEQILSWKTLYGFLYALARISGAIAFVPLAAFRAAPEPARIVLSLALTLILWPVWRAPSDTSGLAGIVYGLLTELAVGLAIGMALAIALEVFQIAAQIITLQAGFGFASTIDPTNGADSTVLLTLAQMTSGLLFFVSGADRIFIRALTDSMRLVPPGEFHLTLARAEGIVRFTGSIFGAGLRLAAPVVALLLLADAALAVLGRVQSQIQLVSLTMPIKLSATMLLLSVTLASQSGVFESLMAQTFRFITAMMQGGVAVGR